MLFNTLQFAAFFAIVYSLYLVLNHKWQNRMLLAASYFFYGAWDWRFLPLILISTVLNYVCGLKIADSPSPGGRKLFLCISVCGNLSILGFFKYFNFFAENLQALLKGFGLSVQPHLLHIILPIGISFYTFQSMSYTIDIYRDEMKPTRNFLDLALFIAYFPQLVAGPIERASRLLPQIESSRVLTLGSFYEGCYLIFLGLFQKVVIADNLAKIADPVFAGPPYNGAAVLIALYAFAFQIFCDFAGYSNIARGLAKCMGIDIMVNFRLPYFASNPREFWHRWHISLSTWLRDYLYIPLGGSRGGPWKTYRNLGLTMLLGGLWHGAAWTFVLWGVYQGALLIGHRLIEPVLKSVPAPRSPVVGKIWLAARVVFFFHLTCLGWLIFRARSVGQLFAMGRSLLDIFVLSPHAIDMAVRLLLFTLLLVVIQIYQHRREDLLVVLKMRTATRAVLYCVMFYFFLIYGVTGGNEFIYFQF